MATSVYDQSMAAFGPLNRLMAGRLDLTNQRIAQEMAMQDFARKQAAQEAQSERSFGRYADLMREQQAARTAESEKAFDRQNQKEKDAAKERKAQREQEEQAARDMEAAKRGYPPGLTREELAEKLAADNNPDAKRKAFISGDKKLNSIYREIKTRSEPTKLELDAIEERAKALAAADNKAAGQEVTDLITKEKKVVYPDGYKFRTSADYIVPLTNLLRDSKKAEIRSLISQAEFIEANQRKLAADIQDIGALMGQQDEVQSWAQPAAEFNPVNKHSTGPDGVAAGGQSTPKTTQAEQVAAGMAMMLQARKQAQNPSTPRTGPSLPLVSEPMQTAGDYWGERMVGDNGRLLGMPEVPSVPVISAPSIGSFGIPPEGQGFQPAQLQTPAYKPYTQQPLIKRIALREYALRRGFAPTEIEAVEAGVAAGDPVATARAKRLHDEMVTELQLQNSAK